MAEQIESHPKKQRTDSITDEFDKTNPFTKGSQFDEIELKFDKGESLFISKSFLSYASPVFKRMFQSQFKESSSKCVKLTGKNYNVFLDMLLNMHPRIGKPISGNKAQDIYKLAHEYDIPTVLKNCCEVAHNQINGLGRSFYTDLKVVFQWLHFAEKYSNLELLSRAAELASVEPVSTLSRHSGYRKLSNDTKNKILLYRLERCDRDERLTGVLPLKTFDEN